MKKFASAALIVVATTMLLMGTLYIPLLKENNNLSAKNNRLEKENECLKDYYISAEHLLDEIFEKYPWVDAMDPVYYYDAVDRMYEEDIFLISRIKSFPQNVL
jgi:hypothetical protein